MANMRQRYRWRTGVLTLVLSLGLATGCANSGADPTPVDAKGTAKATAGAGAGAGSEATGSLSTASTSLAASASGLEYVAMGSSFAAGPSIPPLKSGSVAAACVRSDNNYASVVARETGAKLTDVTCSGATTANILTTSQAGQPAQISAVKSTTRLVTVTIGGNDVNYLGSVTTYSCQNSGGTNCGTVDQAAINTSLAAVSGRIQNVVKAVHRISPQARVFLVNYSTVLPDSSACTGVPLTAAQLAFERGVASRLAAATSAAATVTGATLVDLATVSHGHDACASTPWVEKYKPASGRATYHPNEAGMKAAASLVKYAIGTSSPLPAGYTRCASEGATCSFSGTRLVAFGSGTYAYKTATGSTPCTSASFGGDPASNTIKTCYIAIAGGPYAYTKCASEGGTCSVPGYNRDVVFGSNGNFNHLVTKGSVACNAARFGGDPVLNVAKSCYLAPAGAPAGGWTKCAAENGTCAALPGQPVMYGAYGAFKTVVAAGNTTCTSAAFGGDPVDGQSKSCYTAGGAPAGYKATACATQGGTCAFTGQRTVAYGARGRFVYKTLSGGTTCAAAAFGVDPLYGAVKSCYLTY
ncbi:SGNH/GDSL hydrolase family protein [Streptomyces sp. NPDC002588]|uniref:SGNH/GDSL hydrolase family protein n=1 Tax=Streptomyces sp. NPDC002588 TaxID=3154419 RepID=UPI0033346E32